MTWQGYDSLRNQQIEDLVLVSSLVEELLIHDAMIPPELRAKLDSYHADLASALEAKAESRKAATAAPQKAGEPPTPEKTSRDFRQ